MLFRDPSLFRPARRDVLLGVLGSVALLARRSALADPPVAATVPAVPPAVPPATRPALVPVDLAAVRARADALLARAVRSALGWGWADDQPGVARVRDPRLRSRPIDAAQTAKAGLLLDLAGRATGHAPYRAAAVEAARALSALQTRAGQVRARGVMGMVIGVREETADPPDRRPTCAAIATMAYLLDVGGGGAGVGGGGARGPAEGFDARVRGPLQRAAHWLASQQTRVGGWPSAYPPDAPKGQGQKLLRLDLPDFRDAALAVLLTADLLDDRQLPTYVDRAVDHLTALRVVAGRPARRAMWTSAYRPDGDANPRLAEFPMCVDLLATRHAAEVLLARDLLGAKARPGSQPPTELNGPIGPFGQPDVKPPAAPPLAELRDALASLARTPAGQWHRRYGREALTPMVAPATAPSTQPAGVFDFGRPATQPTAQRVASQVPLRTGELLSRLDRLRAAGPKAVNDELSATMPVRRRLALMVAGLADDALVVDPVRAPAGGNGPAAGDLEEMFDELWRALAVG